MYNTLKEKKYYEKESLVCEGMTNFSSLKNQMSILL